jgi:hypothetical protein
VEFLIVLANLRITVEVGVGVDWRMKWWVWVCDGVVKHFGRTSCARC